MSVTGRLPSCFCGDHTHRDVWFVIALNTSGIPFSVLNYCSSLPLPASAILDPINEVSPLLVVNGPVQCRSRGDDTHPWGSDFAPDPAVAGQYTSRAYVVGYVKGSHDKEDKVFSMYTPLPCITRYGVQILDEILGKDVVRFYSLADLSRASSLTPQQLSHLESLPLYAAAGRLANAVPLGMLFTVYCCIIDQLSLGLGKIDAHVDSLLEHPFQEEDESPLSHLAYSTLTRFDDNDEFLPKSFFRHNLDFVDLLSTANEVHDDGFIDPNSEHVSVDTAPIEVKMERTRPRVGVSQIPLHRPPSNEYYAAKK